VELAGDLPPAIVTDPQKLQQVLRNLLSNAVKFTDHGSVTLRIASADPGSSFEQSTLRGARTVVGFTVSDTGIGISDDKLALIFEAFQQADGTTSRKYGGTGLGLSISRELARLLGGAIAVSSAPGAGSSFTLYLPDVLLPESVGVSAPVVPSPARSNPAILRPAAPARRATAAAHQLDGATVLIVDDDVRNVFALTSALEANGMEVVFAENGRAGIDVLRENPDVDLVLMDIMMPELDGYEAMREIRAIDEFSGLPIISLTAKAMKGDRDRSIEAGASDYITKPVDLGQLLSLMRVWLYR
jgi:CheY-like chemotaxis protein